MERSVSVSTYAALRMRASAGRVRGVVAHGEDAKALGYALIEARERVLGGDVPLLVHGNLRVAATDAQRQSEVNAKLEALRGGKLKRYVFPLATARGVRIVKITEPLGFAHQLQALAGRSQARFEHRAQLRAERLELAATQSCGYLELWRGLRLVRCCQIQTPLDDQLEVLESFFAREFERHTGAAIDALADAMADTHARGFFHADLKGFHAFVKDPLREGGGAATYRLRWLDLGRVSFHLTPRKRIINLYQIFRFILVPDPAAGERFMRRYCKTANWYAQQPEVALAKVRRFLAHKLATHPYP